MKDDGEEICHALRRDWRPQQRDVELHDAKTQVWVAEMNGEVVGFVAAVPDADSRMGEIYMVAVDPDAQNRGFGSRLTEVATDWLREVGMSIVLVSTGGDLGHAAARCAYEGGLHAHADRQLLQGCVMP
jgi:N-acetylglutamate synthase-like GNAT family acetyltransferase